MVLGWNRSFSNNKMDGKEILELLFGYSTENIGEFYMNGD